ncbi:bifunctional 5,10-methylenetetrahydrofolate dehydrogenase/5,10-methenyltetrahydrofolate cyclohydrolase [Tumebacillus permanentifrigoris]|uniref:Bifunctional protein FolD n=1 Tax=Tumebacillus permanentifrigoris TaxID=378543 RepID=A0A316D8U5_9BACL|nr:bifunctional 5,10-methylenetetrahydrofolate dehydrogenase/5,10-methenyltetrahydrofolate cyclohydrolase [Tumebacillus permanentifrigoris]PWK11230.1 methylenetetrahydrofolate dehydrogenase (NADP+)/methenyltetrahydrofolate cyclohydrolase [Tumebacillus permanentifrigoris]
MTKPMKGKEFADSIRQDVLTQVEAWKAQGREPRMATILIEGDPASLYYAEAKGRAADKLGIDYELHKFPGNVTEEFLLNVLDKLNRDPDVHGIMLELPLPKHLTKERIISAIDPRKDVDGLTASNLLATINGTTGLYPATPLACLGLLKHHGYSVFAKHVVLIGIGETVGKPLLHLLLREKATVTVCNSKTPDLALHLKRADYAFVATGRKNLVTAEMVHENLVIVDAGINETEDGSIVGDVAPDVLNHVAAMTPTPGGVGTVTTAQLFANLMLAMKLQLNGQEECS